MELLIDTQGNEKRTLGAVEFGTDATPLFGPGLIGQNAAAYKAALNAALIEDGGGTDYNAAFAAAGRTTPPPRRASSSPTASTPLVEPYATATRAGRPPT